MAQGKHHELLAQGGLYAQLNFWPNSFSSSSKQA